MNENKKEEVLVRKDFRRVTTEGMKYIRTNYIRSLSGRDCTLDLIVVSV